MAVEWSSGGVVFRAESAGEVKRKRVVWDPKKHPRYPKGHEHAGRFIRTGDSVSVGGRDGRVVGTTSGGKLSVERADGSRVSVSPDQLGDSAAPSKPSGAGTAPRSTAGRRSSGRGSGQGGGRAEAGADPGPGPQASVGGQAGGAGRRVAVQRSVAAAPKQSGPEEPLPPLIQVGMTTAKPAMADSQRKAINELNIDAPGSAFSNEARAGASALREKKGLTSEQADALAAAVREAAKDESLTKARRNALNKSATRLDSVSAHLRGISAKNKPASGKAKAATAEDAKEGDLIAFPGPGGTAEVRRVASVQPWYNEFKFTLEDANGGKEERFVSPETGLYRFNDGETFSSALKGVDGDKSKDEEPTSLYDDEEEKEGGSGPGKVTPDVPWYDTLAAHGDNSAPIPVTGLTVNGYTVEHGVAWRRNGRSYLVEQKPGETAEQAKARGDKSAELLESVLSQVPPEKAALQRSLALLEGGNPADSYWEQKYGIKGFHSAANGGHGTTNVWGGEEPKPTTLAHEFGHNIDSQAYGTNQWLSQAPGPVLPGQFLSWGNAVDADAEVSKFYADGRFKETRLHDYVKPVTLGEKGVTGYGQVDVREDFAEAVRLWMKDRREGKLGYDPTTGDNLRFADLFPERARILDAAFGTTTDFDTPVLKKRQKEAEEKYFKHLQSLSDDPDAAPPWADENDGMAKTGLTNVDLGNAEYEAATRWEKVKQEKAAKEEAAKKLAEKKAELEKATAGVSSIQAALESGRLADADAEKFRAQVAAYKKDLREVGYSETEIAQLGAAYETQLMHGTFGLGPDMSTRRYMEGWNDAERLAADAWVKEAGTYIHPLAQDQHSTAPQAKANIAAELASRLNNPDGWEVYQKWSQAARGYAPGPFESYDEEYRHQELAEAVSRRVSAWAGTSGDSNHDAILMQEAIKQEFQVTGPSAPAFTKEKFDALMEAKWESHGPWFQKVSRVMYEHTQEEFRDAGITHVSLFRGMGFHGKTPSWALDPGLGAADLQPANSWSSQRSTAMMFTSGEHRIMLRARIPVELIVGSARTGFGCLDEEELVVLSAMGGVLVEVLDEDDY